jgi:leucyl/phenylalanyl-tRNA--protein transferase
MFHIKTDASKIAFVNMVNHLQTKQVGMIDCQMKTSQAKKTKASQSQAQN